MGDVLTDTPVKAGLDTELGTRCKPVKRDRSFTGSQQNARNSIQLKRLRRVPLSDEENDYECFRTECAESYSTPRESKNGSNNFSALNGPMRAAPNLARTEFRETQL